MAALLTGSSNGARASCHSLVTDYVFFNEIDGEIVQIRNEARCLNQVVLGYDHDPAWRGAGSF